MAPSPPSSAVDKITLDREVFKALASDTRLDILKALDVRQKTVTELAKELGLNKATVFEHLEKLAAVGLIQKLEDDRKWVYWQLSWTGRRLLHPEKITLAVLLSTAGGSLVTAVVAAWLWLQSNIAPTDVTAKDGPGIMAAPEGDAGRSAFATQPPPGEVPPEIVQHDPVLLAVAVALGLVFLALALWAARVYVKSRAAEAQPSEGAEA